MALLPAQKPEKSTSDALRDNEKREETQRKKKYIRSVKRRIPSGRKCKICGKDASPNYFYCTPCHYRISSLEETDGLTIRFEEL